MKGFIELTNKESSRKILVNVSKIQVVYDEGMTTHICIVSHVYSRKCTHYVIEVEETYWEVKELISKAQTVTLDDIEEIEE